ncbi:hypothetical protein BH11PSE14_BH11PSE14_03050 [soil metagenome]
MAIEWTVVTGKRIAVAAIVCCAVVAGCSKPSAPTADATAPPLPTTTQAAKAGLPGGPASPGVAVAGSELALLRAYLDAWNAHDIARAAGFFDEQGEYFDSAFAGVQRGRPAIEENAIGVFMRGVPNLHWEVRSDPIVGPEGVAFEWTLTGTHTGTWGGVRATGQKIQLKGMSFMRIRNGKITYQAVVYDSGALNRQLGL